MLLTVPERRQTIADLRLVGHQAHRDRADGRSSRRSASALAASLLGLLAGYALSSGRFHQSAGYLAQAFTLGGGTVVGLSPVLLSFSGGFWRPAWPQPCPCSTCAAGAHWTPSTTKTASPATRSAGELSGTSPMRPAACSRPPTAISCSRPSLALLACAVLALRDVLAVPLTFAGVLRAAQAAHEPQRAADDPAGRAHVAQSDDRCARSRSPRPARSRCSAASRSAAHATICCEASKATSTGTSAGASIWIVNPADPAAVEPLPRAYAERRMPDTRGRQGGWLPGHLPESRRTTHMGISPARRQSTGRF